MFAPKIVGTQTKPATNSTSSLLRQRAGGLMDQHGHGSLGQLLELQRRFGNQAMLRLLAERAGDSTGHDWSDQRGARVAEGGREASTVTPDFSKIPINSPGRADGYHPLFSPTSSPSRGAIQPKLVIGAVDDPLEYEADRIADQVMRVPALEMDPTAAPPQIGRKCADCEEEQLQRKEAGTTEAAAEASADVCEVLRAPGEPLDPPTRAYFEPRFGHDFSRVRVHTDARGERSAQDLAAQAYTVGNDIVFGRGRYAPHTQEGKRLLAHELTHVVQQWGRFAFLSSSSVALPDWGIPGLGATPGARLQRAPSDPPRPSVEVLGGTSSTSATVELYHYGNLEGVTAFKSPPGYPRLTDCDIATSQAEAAQYTGTPINNNLRYKYMIRIDEAYFDKNFRNSGTRGAYSEYVTKDPIPVKYFTQVATLTITPPQGGSPKSGTGGGQTPPERAPGETPTTTTTTGTRVTAGVALAVLGVNIAFNWVIGALNERRIRQALEARANELEDVHQKQSNLGILLIFRFRGGADSGEGPTAAARFEGLSYLTALSQDNAMAQWRRQPQIDPSMRYEFQWIDALSPLAVPPVNWDPVALAKFADLSEIEFQRMQFAQIGGFDTKGTVGPVNYSRYKFAEGYEFIVLQIPRSIPYYGPGGGLNHESVTVENREVVGGTAPAMIVDGVAVTAVVAANSDTRGFFHARGAQAEMEIDDKVDALRAVPNIREIRWLRLKQIRVVKKI